MAIGFSWCSNTATKAAKDGLAALTALAMLTAGAGPAWAQGAPPPQPAPEQPPPPMDEPMEDEPPVDEVNAPPDDQPPPPYYAPPPGYGQPPPGYGYGYPQQPMGPEEIDYEEGQPIPPGYYRTSKIRKGLVIGGAATMGGLWLISFVAGLFAYTFEAAEEADGVDDDSVSKGDAAMLMIPVAGPFISIATYEAKEAGLAVLLIDGIGQAGGLAMLIAGLAAQRDVLVRTGGVEIRPSAVVGENGAGIGLTGSF